MVYRRRIGTLTANQEWFLPWRTIEGEKLADKYLTQLQVMLEGVFEKRRFLDLIKYFIVFEDAGGGASLRKWRVTTSTMPLIRRSTKR